MPIACFFMALVILAISRSTCTYVSTACEARDLVTWLAWWCSVAITFIGVPTAIFVFKTEGKYSSNVPVKIVGAVLSAAILIYLWFRRDGVLLPPFDLSILVLSIFVLSLVEAALVFVALNAALVKFERQKRRVEELFALLGVFACGALVSIFYWSILTVE